MDDDGTPFSGRQSRPNNNLEELQEEVNALRQMKTVLLQETENLRRERLQEELQEMKRSVAMLEQTREQLDDYLRPRRSNVYQQIGRLVYIIPPAILLLVCCNVQAMQSDWLFVFITMYTYAVSCYIECKMNDDVRAPVSVAIYVSAAIVAIITSGTSSIWKEMANVYTQLSFVAVIWLAMTHFYKSVTERGVRSLSIPEYVPVAGYGAFVGIACEWYWGHQQQYLIIRNISILMVYYTLHYFIMCIVYRASRKSHQEHIVRRHSFLWELLRASAVYAIFFLTQQFSKGDKTPELTHGQSIAEIFFCLEFIRRMFTTLPMLIDDFCFSRRSGVSRTRMLIYVCASIALCSGSQVSFPVVRALFIFITWLLFYQIERRFVRDEKIDNINYNIHKIIKVVFISNILIYIYATAIIHVPVSHTRMSYLNEVVTYEVLRTLVNMCILFVLSMAKLGSDIFKKFLPRYDSLHKNR